MPKKRMAEDADLLIAAIDFVVTESTDGTLNRAMPSRVSEELVEALNNQKLDSASKTRLSRIIHLLKRREEVKSRVRCERTEARQRALLEEFAKDAHQLNNVLLRYKVTPQIDLYAASPMVFYKSMDSSKKSKTDEIEITAVMRLLQLAERDELHRIRKCSCGRFFLAGRIDQHYHSARCRVHANQSSEEFKIKRRAADRERYRLLFHPDAKET